MKSVIDATEFLYEFLEVAIHSILYFKKLYPSGIFVKQRKYGVIVYKSVHPHLTEYVNETLKTVKFFGKENQLGQLVLCTTSNEIIHERFVFNIIDIKNSFESDPLLINLENNLREFYLKLQSSCSYLDTLPENATFRILLHTTNYCKELFNDELCQDTFPWISVSKDECKITSPNIIPFHTIDTDALKLHIYIEKKTKKSC